MGIEPQNIILVSDFYAALLWTNDGNVFADSDLFEQVKTIHEAHHVVLTDEQVTAIVREGKWMIKDLSFQIVELSHIRKNRGNHE